MNDLIYVGVTLLPFAGLVLAVAVFQELKLWT
jgi:hypothetical protein